MPPDEQPVRLVVLGGATGAPVCEGDVCYLPDSTVDSVGDASDSGDEHGPETVDDK
jgi:hypothetical protein